MAILLAESEPRTQRLVYHNYTLDCYRVRSFDAPLRVWTEVARRRCTARARHDTTMLSGICQKQYLIQAAIYQMLVLHSNFYYRTYGIVLFVKTDEVCRH